MSFTDLQGKKVGAKELVAGVTYITRQQEELVYLGKFDYHFVVEYTRNHYYGRVNSYDTDYYKKLGYDVTKEFNEPSKADAKGVNKRFVFWNGKKKLIALSSIRLKPGTTLTKRLACSSRRTIPLLATALVRRRTVATAKTTPR